MTTPTPTSPDLDPYAGLTLDPRSAQDFVDMAIQNITTALAGYQPKEGQTEVVLIESLALIIGELVYRLNMVPIVVVETLLDRIYDTPRLTGNPASANVTIDFVDTQARTLPGGTQLALTLSGSTFLFITDADLNVPDGASSGTVGIRSLDNTSQVNGTPAGTVMTVIDSVSYVNRATLATAITGGNEQETDQAYLDRGMQLARRLTSTLSMPDNFVAAALAYPGVFRATAVDNYDPGSGNQPGMDAGHITVVPADATGAALSSGVKAALLASLQAVAAGQLAIHTDDPTITAVAVTATLSAFHGSDPTVVHDAAVAALQSYLSPATWSWDGTVRIYELVALLSNVPGVNYVQTLAAPSSDVALTGAAPLAQAGTLTITVNVE